MRFGIILRTLIHSVTRQKVLTVDQMKVTKLSKCLGTLDLLAIGIGSTFGSGIYVLTGQVAKTLAGPAVVLSFLFASIASLLSGLCYIEFATRVPKAGSAYIYTYISIGELMAFFTGWNLILEYSIGAAVVARGCSVYLDALTNGAIANGTRGLIGEIHGTGLSRNIDFVSFLLVILITILLATGIRNSSLLNNILTVFNLAIAAIIIISGVFFVNKENWSNFTPFGFHGVLAGASTCFFAFIGFDIIATTAEEARTPGKSMPISIIGTIFICLLIYIGISSVITLMVPYSDLDANTAVSDAFKHVGASWVYYVVSAGAGISILCCTLVSMIPLPRMLYSMAQDGLLFKVFSRVNKKTEVPLVATVTAGVFTAFLAMFIDLDQLVEMLSIGTLLAYTIVDMCVLKLRYEFKPKVGASSDDKEEQRCRDKEMKKRNRSVVVAIALIVINMMCMCIVLVYGRHLDTVSFYFLVSLFASLVIACGIFLSVQKQNQEQLVFKAPCVPLLPMAASFFNIYLMLELRRLTWIRLLVWMIIGTVVYFGYGIRNSSAGSYVISEIEETSPLVTIHNKSLEKGEKSQ
eukprot:gene15450-17033_t